MFSFSVIGVTEIRNDDDDELLRKTLTDLSQKKMQTESTVIIVKPII